MSLLLLGGTAEAKQLARVLASRGVDLIYSIAGLVRQPELECRVVSGGFTQFGGLPRFIADEAVCAIVDATHPYASAISAAAVNAGRDCEIPVWRYQRPPWQPRKGDYWREFADWTELPSMLQEFNVVLLTAGRLAPEIVEELGLQAAVVGQRQLLRSATKPRFTLPDSMTWIEDIGPFTVESERALCDEHGVDALVSKNSGGEATSAKLAVARERGMPVFLLRRPGLPSAVREFTDLDALCEFVVTRCSEMA